MMKNKKKTAKLAGILYLLVILFGVFAELYVRAKLFIPKDIDGTVQNILEHQTLLRLGFISDLAMQVTFFLLVLVLYHLLHKFNKSHAILMLSSVIIAVAIMCLNMLNQFAVILILENDALVAAFDIPQRNSLIYLFLDLQKHGYRIAQIFFGIWLFPLGYLSYLSGLIPKTIGILLMIACWAFLLDFILFFTIKDYSAELSSIITLPTSIAEISMCLWLLIKGVREGENDSRVLS